MHVGSGKSIKGFNSTLVQLKAAIENVPHFLGICFNSTLVQLKGVVT